MSSDCPHGTGGMGYETRTLFRQTRHYGYDIGCNTELRGWVIGATALGGVLLVAFLLIFGVTMLTRNFDERSCERWGESTGREVNFVDYHFFGWDCMVHIDDGRWITKQQVVAIEGEGGRLKIDIQQGED